MTRPRQVELHRSNRMDRLVEKLADVLVSRPLPPMSQEWIVIQGPAIQRWTAMQLSTELGIVANTRFLFPGQFVHQTIASVLRNDPEETSVLDEKSLFWAIAQEIEYRFDEPEFAEIRRYLDPPKDSEPSQQQRRKHFELAARIADVFERYTVYRRDLLETWTQGHGDGWQPTLWRYLNNRPGAIDHGTVRSNFLNTIRQTSNPITGIPDRLCIFGVAALPPLYMETISAIATQIETHLFVVSPSRQYWADIRRNNHQSSDLRTTVGNPLLLSLGQVSADFQYGLEENGEYNESDEDLYHDPCDDHDGQMLATIQSDILNLRYRHQRHPGSSSEPNDERTPPPLPIKSSDRSISVHSCHSPMRELEVLHDQLVAKLEEVPALETGDIIVMTPNIEEYGPFVDAVFSNTHDGRPHLPYRIADRSDRSRFPVVHAFIRILSLLTGRLPASSVLDLLDIDVIRDRFEIAEDELPQLLRWTAEAGIRWGEDPHHRESLGQPDFSENTWRFGLDRLLLGLAMESEEQDLYNTVLPYDDMEGTHIELLGKFISFCDVIFAGRHAIADEKSPSEWGAQLVSILNESIACTEDNANQHQLIRESVITIEKNASDGDFTSTVPFDTIFSLLKGIWSRNRQTNEFLTGGITFCQLMPTRSLPFCVVCLVGMSDGTFPRAAQPLGFDEMAANPKLGDRPPRSDDRHLFLEAIMAAKDSLLISYVGKNSKNNTSLPPSVFVGELLDVLEDSFTVEKDDVRARVVTHHPLQPFSPRYFDSTSDAKLFSYSSAYCSGATSLAASPLASAPFLTTPLVTSSDLQRHISLDDLVGFFQRPTQHFLEKQLRLFLTQNDTEIAEREPIELNGLDAWRVMDHLLQRVVAGADLETLLPVYRAAGRLPLGAVGESWFDEARQTITTLYKCSQKFIDGVPLDNVPVDISIGNYRLTGQIDKLWNKGRVHVTYSRISTRSEIEHWIRHLVLCMLAPLPDTKRTIVVGRHETKSEFAAIEFVAVADAETLLQQLITLYEVGQTVPLPFFPNTARKFVSSFENHKVDRSSPTFTRCLEEARALFTQTQWQGTPESQDPYVSQVFGNDECLDVGYRPFANVPANYTDFPTIANTLLSPLLVHRRELHL